jgi:hypothetical protein
MAKRNGKRLGNKAQGTTPVSGSGTGVNSRAKVNYYREELNSLLPQYYLIRDCIEGEMAVKGMIGTQSNYQSGAGNGGLPLTTTNILIARALRYLPQPNPEDKSKANIERYKSYVMRAQFYNVTGRTLEGMTGQIFLRAPVAEIPTELQMMVDDADGSGMTLEQAANRCVRHCISYGRTGLLVDYPVTNGDTTKKELEEDAIRPTFIIYNPWDIINWRVEMRGAEKIITFLVLREVIDEEGDDGFQLSTYEQFRVLSIDPDSGDHLVELYSTTKSGFTQTATYTPKDASGKTFQKIPFMFIGSENNEVLPNKPPLYDLASTNISHYRNSADYEESCYQAGQPTLVLTGLSEDWVTNVLKGSVALGSRAAIPLPVAATANILQAKPNSMPFEAMTHKEAQMVALGAKLVTIQRVAKTATQQIIETTSESSPLTTIAKNVSSAIVWALGIAADFVGAVKDSIKYDLNKEFDLTSMTADDQNAIILQWQSGALASSEMRTALTKAGVATLTDVAWKAEVKKDIEDGIIADPVAPVLGNQATPPNDGGQPPKAASGEGGPQPGPRRRLGTPKGSA